MEQAKITCSPLGKSLEKQAKAFKCQCEKQVKAFKGYG